MAKGDLTRHFGPPLAELLATRFESAHSRFDAGRLRETAPRLERAALMQRVRILAEALHQVLPADPHSAWETMAAILPPPLSQDQQVFNDGYWMLPLAAYWEIRGHTDEIALDALEELTQRGTAEFAIRPLVVRDPETVLRRIEQWRRHPSFHVRRLASEGTRPYLPWGGKLRVGPEMQRRFLDAITPLATDPVAYVRRSVGNHVRDWRRIDAEVADAWIAQAEPPEDVRRLAGPRRPRRSRKAVDD